jgi:hypothetical protein
MPLLASSRPFTVTFKVQVLELADVPRGLADLLVPSGRTDRTRFRDLAAELEVAVPYHQGWAGDPGNREEDVSGREYEQGHHGRASPHRKLAARPSGSSLPKFGAVFGVQSSVVIKCAFGGALELLSNVSKCVYVHLLSFRAGGAQIRQWDGSFCANQDQFRRLVRSSCLRLKQMSQGVRGCCLRLKQQ